MIVIVIKLSAIIWALILHGWRPV